MNPQLVHTQEDVEDIILAVLADGSVKTTIEITLAVKARLNLTPADKARAAKRPNESKVDQIIANALQARRRLCSRQLIFRVAKGAFQIAPLGTDYLADRRAKAEEGAATLKTLFPDQSWD